jgi:outer membrane receptor protein involved in Fe transport
MKRFAAILFTVIFFSLGSFAQEKGAILKGTLFNQNQEPIPYAAVTVHAVTDSTIIKGVTSGIDGNFILIVSPGTCLLKASFLSYQDLWIGPFTHTNEIKDLGVLAMFTNTALLDEVEVIADRQIMEFKLDKRVINVQQDLSNRGRNASEILDNIPSVGVDIEGNVSLRGSDNVRILIDGKPSGLVGISSADALRQLQGDLIESIEVITNPSAKYEAEGEVGIINIILKKERKKGVNGSIDLNAGVPDSYGAAVNLNFRKKDFNLFTSVGANSRRNPGEGKVYQEFLLADTTYVFDNSRVHNRGGTSGNFRLGSEFFLNPKNTLTISGLTSISEGDNDLEIRYDDYNSLGALTQSSLRSEEESEDTEVLEFNLNYLKTFSSKDHKLSFDLKRQYRIDLEESSITQVFQSDATDNLVQRSANSENEWNWVIQLDYEQTFAKDVKLETGLRTGLRAIENDYQVEQFDLDWTDVPGFVNELSYREDIYAAYATYSNEQGRLGYQLGLRAEYSDVETELLLTEESNPRDYLDFFPSAFLSYKYSEFNSLQLSYSRRINRPRFWSLVPFFGFGDPRNFYSGNPDLNPEYTHSIELNRLARSDKGSIITGVYARYKEGVIQRIVNVGIEGTTTFPVNIGTEYNIGAEISGSHDLKDWWKLSGSINVFYEDFDGAKDGRDYSYNTLASITRLTSKWDIKKIYDFQASVNYRSPVSSVQGKRLSITAIDLGLSRDIMKGKGTMTLSVRDLLNSRKRRSVIDRDDYYSETEFQWRSRSAQIGFNYRINQKKDRRSRGGDFGGGDDM